MDGTNELPFGWHRRANGEVWSNASDKARPILYRVGGKWMVCGTVRPEELSALAALALEVTSQKPAYRT